MKYSFADLMRHDCPRANALHALDLEEKRKKNQRRQRILMKKFRQLEKDLKNGQRNRKKNN